MTIYSDNLRIPHLDQNAVQPEIPENTAKYIIDQILTKVYSLETVDDQDIIITHSDSAISASNWQSFIFEIKDTGLFLTAAINIILPNNERPYIFKNSTVYNLTFKTSSGSGFQLNPSQNAYAFCNGVDIEKLEFAASGAGSTFDSLNDTPVNKTNGSFAKANGSNIIWYDLQTDLDEKLDHTGGTLTNYGETLNSLGVVAGVTDIDLANGNMVKADLAGATTFTFTTTHDNTSFSLLISAAGAAVTWPAGVLWGGGAEPVLSIVEDDLIVFMRFNGIWIGNAILGIA